VVTTGRDQHLGVGDFVDESVRAAVETVLADPRLVALGELRRGPFLDVPDPRLRILQATPDQFRAVQVTLEP
jgi:hypothetical protein